MKDLPASELLKAQMITTVGVGIGLLFSVYFLVISKLWYFMLAIFFGVALQVIQAVSLYKAYIMAKETEELINSAKVSLDEENESGNVYEL